MSDPANEAAKRAIPVPPPRWMLDDKIIDSLSEYGIAAAREALKPIREKYEELLRFHEGSVEVGPWRILDDLAKLIYTTEELAQ